MNLVNIENQSGLLTELQVFWNRSGWGLLVIIALLSLALAAYLFAPFLQGVAAIIHAVKANEVKNAQLQAAVDSRLAKPSLASDKDAVHSQKLKRTGSSGPAARRERRK